MRVQIIIEITPCIAAFPCCHFFFPAVSSNGHSGSNLVQTGMRYIKLVVRWLAKLRQHSDKILLLLCLRKDNVCVTLIMLAWEGHILYSEMFNFDVVFLSNCTTYYQKNDKKDKMGTI